MYVYDVELAMYIIFSIDCIDFLELEFVKLLFF